MEGGVLHESEVYPTGVGTQSGPTLEGFLIIKKKKKKKNVEYSSLSRICISFPIRELLVECLSNNQVFMSN
jgi:hypothetical protein